MVKKLKKLKFWQNSKTQIFTKLKISNCDKTQIVREKKFKNIKCDKTQIVTKLENSKYDKKKLKNLNCDNTQKLKLCQNFKFCQQLKLC